MISCEPFSCQRTSVHSNRRRIAMVWWNIEQSVVCATIWHARMKVVPKLLSPDYYQRPTMMVRGRDPFGSFSLSFGSLPSWWLSLHRFVCTSFPVRVGWSFACLSWDQFSHGFWARLWSILQQHVCHLWTISHSRYYIGHTSDRFRSHTDHFVFL